MLVEFFDELVFGAWSAAWPSIRTDLALSYVEVGLLFALPQAFAGVLEPPLGLLGDSWNRRLLVRAGGAAFAGGLLLVAGAGDFASLLVALMLVFPASGAFVGLSQATLMDAAADSRQRELNMARWTLVGSLGVVAGPVLLSAADALGFGWRATFAALAVLGAASLALAWATPMPRPRDAQASAVRALRAAAGEALRALRKRAVLRWLALLQAADLLLDVFHGFLALYLVEVSGTTGARAAFAIVVYTGMGLLGDALMLPLLRRIDGARYLRASACAMLLAFPAFLLLGDSTAKLALLGLVGLLGSGWYPVLKARLYAELPGRSATVMALDSLSGVAGATLPLLVGLAAEILGLGPAMWLLAAAPIALLAGVPRPRAAPPRR